MKGKKDPIMDGIESGRIYGMKCEALKDAFENLKFCQIRDECAVLSEHMTWINEMENVIRELNCPFCESDKWYFVGITKDGTMIIATMTKEHAKKINSLIDKVGGKGK